MTLFINRHIPFTSGVNTRIISQWWMYVHWEYTKKIPSMNEFCKKHCIPVEARWECTRWYAVSVRDHKMVKQVNNELLITRFLWGIIRLWNSLARSPVRGAWGTCGWIRYTVFYKAPFNLLINSSSPAMLALYDFMSKLVRNECVRGTWLMLSNLQEDMTDTRSKYEGFLTLDWTIYTPCLGFSKMNFSCYPITG